VIIFDVGAVKATSAVFRECVFIATHLSTYQMPRECNTKQIKLEIWGKAQRESARHPMSDWGKLGG